MELKLGTAIIKFMSNRSIYYVSLILFFWYANHPDLFERKFFINEFLSAVGFMIFFSNPVFYRKGDYIYNNVIFIVVTFLFYALISLLFFENFDGYLRNTVLLYSVFSFFLGTRLYDALSKVKKYDILFLSAIFPVHKVSYLALIPLYLSKLSKSFSNYSVIIIFFGLFAIAWVKGGSSSVAVALLILFIWLMSKRTKLLMLFVAVGVGIWFILYLKPYLGILMTDGIWVAMSRSEILQLDGNSTTRFFMWSWLIFERFYENVFGIGLGTAMLEIPFLKDLNMGNVVKSDPLIEYTLGAHNSFIGIMVRFGLIGIIPFICLYWRIINSFTNDKIFYSHSKVFFFYYAFFIITGCAMLNVVLESPIHASLYWGVLGLLYQAIQDTRLAVGANAEV